MKKLTLISLVIGLAATVFAGDTNTPSWLTRPLSLTDALNTALLSGDYVDEVYFYSTATTDGTAQPADTFSVSGWDNDEIFRPCHSQGRFAIVDPYDLLFCTESELDRRIFADPVLYRRYVDLLAEPEGEEHLGRGGHQARDPHARMVAPRAG